MSATIVELDDVAWANTRNAVTRRYLGLDAGEFVARFESGEYDDDEPEALMTILAYFPELED